MNKVMWGVVFSLLSSMALAVPAIESVRDLIVKKLKKNNQTALVQFNNFYKQFEDSVHEFFDKNNDQPLNDHIKRMEGEVETLARVCKDLDFRTVWDVLQEHHMHVLDLISILRSYIGSHNSVAFALRLKRFEFLVPADIRKRGLFAIFRSLHHRLMC